jgi:hypothetical protein
VPKKKKARKPVVSLEERIRKVKALSLIALVSDDSLMERLVLKGGSSLDLIHGVSERPSIDIDMSMENDFPEEERATLQERFHKLLSKTFGDPKLVGDTFGGETLVVFDLVFQRKPEAIAAELESFWGGYQLKFKLLLASDSQRLAGRLEDMRRHALEVGPAQHKTFVIEISRFEYCERQAGNIEGYTVYAYPPGLVVAEKLRAICQQMPEYRKIVRSMRNTPRARDFVDIFNIIEKFKVDMQSETMREVLRRVFAAKRVPLSFLGKIPETRSFHEADFAMVKSTLSHPEKLRPFGEYFDFVLSLVDGLKALWDEQAPT